MYKVICLDLDGTLLNDKKEISNLNLKVLETLQKNNLEIVIATGRGLSRTIELTSSFKFPYTIIANNGAIAKLSSKSDILFCNCLNEKTFKEVNEVGQELKMIPYVHIFDELNNKSLVVPNHTIKEHSVSSVEDINEIIYFNEIEKNELDSILSIVFIDKKNLILELDKEIGKLKLNISSHILTNTSENRFLSEYLHPLAQKSIGIDAFLKYKEISWEEVISFGDDNNDIEMIKKSGLGVCMKNGSELLKINSKYISYYNNNEDGVSRELIKIFGGIEWPI